MCSSCVAIDSIGGTVKATRKFLGISKLPIQYSSKGAADVIKHCSISTHLVITVISWLYAKCFTEYTSGTLVFEGFPLPSFFDYLMGLIIL